ncbi:MAG: DUF1549 and DUF1553 domain-containing protein [Roseibacillus sp.]|nr:DUF1549 and DUF1553 domain-containing protein [Roseibacillus sp.]
MRVPAAVFLGIAVLLPVTAQGGVSPDEARSHWAFQAPTRAALPGKGHPVDELLAIRQGDKPLAPVPEASRAILLRRAWHVITGLQPESDLRERVLAQRGEALSQWSEGVVDEALASPHFGERWARHWLDVTRYADTKGYNFTAGRLFPFAFTYRDWVVRSLNEDLPYDEFLRRQIAADLMDVPVKEQAALGFLTLGRRYLNKHDLIIADRIDVTFRSTMGITMQCVRCHDHKSDPLTMADYYGIYGVFDSTEEVPEGEQPVISTPEDSPGYRKFREELTKRANAAHDYAAEKIKGYQRPADPLKFDRKAALNKLDQSERGKYRGLLAKLDELEGNSEFAPARAMAVRDRPNPREPVIFERGQQGNRGAKVPRAFPAFFRAAPDRTFEKGSGRLELAQQLTRAGNPLTARVCANRVWMHVMGAPLVTTPGDFGLQAQQPLHAGLLDHLALYLQEHDWSIKALVRHIMTSQAWRRSSLADDRLAEHDPENRYHARSNRHRKDLESWRDTTLQASGRLDRRLGGRPVKIHAAPFPGRRTIYGLIERQNTPSFFRIFDFPDTSQPVVKRASTTTPNQALYLMNSPFLHGEARATAAATASHQDEEARIMALYLRVLLRAPSPAELGRARRFLGSAEPGRRQSAGAWSYGHGRVHRDSGRVDFNPLPHFTGKVWQGGAELPDQKTGWVHWHSLGGHPGHGDHAAILRWVAPRKATVRISGELVRPDKKGDAIRGLVVAGNRILGEWTVGPGAKSGTNLTLQVAAGETVDFLVESTGEEACDSFYWAPVILEKGAKLPLAEAQVGFSGPALDRWPLLAQVLLLSNEFLYVD